MESFLNSQPQVLYVLTQEALDGLIDAKAQIKAAELAQSISKSTEEEPIDTRKVMELLDVKEDTVHAWKRKGKLPFHKIEGRTFYFKSEILDAVKKNGLIKTKKR